MSEMLDDIDVRVIEPNDDINEEDNKKTSLDLTPQEIKFQTLMVRIGTSCLAMSAILFLGHLVSAACSWRQSAADAVTGFGLSIFLFLIWMCINSVYGKDNAVFGMKVSEYENYVKTLK